MHKQMRKPKTYKGNTGTYDQSVQTSMVLSKLTISKLKRCYILECIMAKLKRCYIFECIMAKTKLFLAYKMRGVLHCKSSSKFFFSAKNATTLAFKSTERLHK